MGLGVGANPVRPYNFSMPRQSPAPNNPARLFLALWPESGVRQALLAHQHAWHWPDACALVRPQNLHLTLHFIGAVPRERLEEITGRLAVPLAPFELALGRPALWPDGVSVLEPLAVPDALLQLREGLGLALQQLALPVESRPFRPHVTLARRAGGAKAPASVPPLHWPVKDYALIESSAGLYQVLRRYA